jgi:hypothetical protein
MAQVASTVIVEADKEGGLWTFRGTNTGDFELPAPAPATGKQVSVSGMNTFHFQEDTMGMLQQRSFMSGPEQ